MARSRNQSASIPDPLEKVQLGRTDLFVTRIGLGGGPLAGLFDEVTEEAAFLTIQTACDKGIRLFDTAPLYGHGLSETRMGSGLRSYPRDSFVLATKVGRLLEPVSAVEAARLVTNFHNPLPFRPVFDFSYEGIMRSFEESLRRVNLERIDILYIHDPDDHHDEVIHEAYPAVKSLRRQGVVGAIGAAMNQVQMLLRFARECDFDCFLLAGRYTLLEQTLAQEFLSICHEKRIGVIIGGPYNSGILATGARPGAKYNYASAPAALLGKVRRLEAICASHQVPLKAAALQFPLRHPAVASVIPGARSAREMAENLQLAAWPISEACWAELDQFRLRN